MIANAKFLQLYSIFLHRQYQIATAKDTLNSYASLHHLWNTKNQNQPFHKTLDILSKLLIKKAGAATAVTASIAVAATAATATAAGTGRTIDTNIKNVPTTNGSIQTPPKIAQFNLRGSFQKVHNYTTTTGGIPGKGRSINPKNKTAAYKEDRQQLEDCQGLPFLPENEINALFVRPIHIMFVYYVRGGNA